MNTKIGPDNLTVYDNFILSEGLNSRPFDAEGCPSQITPIIENGKLVNLIYNTTTARLWKLFGKFKAKTTANSYLGSPIMENIGPKVLLPMPSNTVYKQGDYSFDEIVAESKKPTIYITSNWYTRFTNYLEGTFSATAEDLLDASFAGQQDTYLNIFGESEILDHILKCMGSVFTSRATQYRERAGFNHFDVKLSVAIQEMAAGLEGIRASGVMCSIDPDSGNQNFVLIRGTWGLGEIIVQGKEVGDEYKVFKHSKLGLQITSKTRVAKHYQLVPVQVAEEEGYEVNQHVGTVEIPVPPNLVNTLCLSDPQVEQLAQYAILIADHYKRPMDIEWVLGNDENIYIIQARPETVEFQKGDREEIFYLLEDFEKLKMEGRILDESGVPIGRKIGAGPIKIIKDISEAWKLKKGDILVTEETNPDWTTYLEHLSAIITEKGGPTCHAAIVSREQGIPCIVGAENIINKIMQFKNSEEALKYLDEDKQLYLTVATKFKKLGYC